MPSTFDPDAAAQPGSGIFGLPSTRDQSRIVLVPVPFDATTSYGGGAAAGPNAILGASAQVDLHDAQFGPVYRRGIFLDDEPPGIRELSLHARALAEPIIAAGGVSSDPTPAETAALATIEAAGRSVNAAVERAVSAILDQGKIPGIVGGDHSTPFGAIRACALAAAAADPSGGLGLLQIDAHMDLRDAFEGFRYSHASITHNVVTQIPQVTRVVQVGLRDVGKGEIDLSASMPDRLFPHFDLDWARRLLDGQRFSELCRSAIEPLPRHVYITFDIDGLDPALCPHTGTPVPGGLSFSQAAILLQAVRDSGRTVVGFDLVEVTPSPDPAAPEWDANVGARILYKLCGAASPAE